MKISGPGRIQSKTVQKTTKKSGASGAGFANELSSIDSTAATSGPAGAAAAGPITNVDALLALQEVPDATSGRSKGLARAQDLLDGLEEIRKGILLGAIPVSRLKSLAQLARNNQDKYDDPRLSEILAEIELRAEVELAKLGV